MDLMRNTTEQLSSKKLLSLSSLIGSFEVLGVRPLLLSKLKIVYAGSNFGKIV